MVMIAERPGIYILAMYAALLLSFQSKRKASTSSVLPTQPLISGFWQQPYKVTSKEHKVNMAYNENMLSCNYLPAVQKTYCLSCQQEWSSS
jgi:hypothetical protein